MRYSAEHKQETRLKLLDAAARRFRAQGYDGLGIDGLTKEAGVTNGAFYSNFASKAEAFRTIVESSMDGLAEGIAKYQNENDEQWLEAFAEHYFSDAKVHSPEETCPLPAFAPEVARAPKDTKEAFQERLEKVAQVVASGLPDTSDDPARPRVWTLLALLAGGVMMARAVEDEDLIQEIAASIQKAVSDGKF